MCQTAAAGDQRPFTEAGQMGGSQTEVAIQMENYYYSLQTTSTIIICVGMSNNNEW